MAVSGLYEAVVWRTIKSQVQDGPRLARVPSLCVINGSVICFMADENEEVTMFEFDCQVDAIGWSQDKGTLLVAGDRQGLLHFIAPDLECILFSQQLVSNSQPDADEPFFKAIELTATTQEGVCELIVLDSKGLLHIFQNLHLANLQRALQQSDFETVKKLQSDIQLSQLDLNSHHDIWTSSVLPIHLNNGAAALISLGCGVNGVCIWQRSSKGNYEKHDSISYILQGTGMVACDVTRDGRYMISLTNSETVAVWLLASLVMVNVWVSASAGIVKDFALYQSHSGVKGGANEPCSDKLCLITEDAEKQRSLHLVSLPSLAVLCTMPVSASAGLFRGHLTEEFLFFIEAKEEDDQCLVIKQVTQALPENRLTSLLTQQRYTEAEEFAQKFKLDPQLVYRSKAEVLNAVVCRDDGCDSSSQDNNGEEPLTSLTQCLDTVEDVRFVVDLVLSSSYPSLATTLKMLHFAKTKLHAHHSGRSNDTDSMVLKIFTALNKLTTFQMMFGEDGFSPQKWRSFLDVGILDHFRVHLQLGHLQQASCVWSRHQGALVLELDSNNILPLFHSIPESVPSSELCPWLCSESIPFLLQHTPHALGSFLQWVEQRIRALELSEKELWPTNGLSFVSAVLVAVSSFKNPAAKMVLQPHCLTLMDSSNDECSPLASLKSLQQRLTDLLYLMTSLQCPISLSNHEKESHEAIAFRLLDKVVAAELVSLTVNTKVKTYTERHKLNLDLVLLNYINIFLLQAPRYATGGLTDSPYEAKAIALVHAIEDRELHITGCIELLKLVHPPWSESVEELVQSCLQVDLPCVVVLQRQFKLLQLKKMLHGYSVRDFNFSDVSKGRLYIRRVLSSDGAAILADALQVAEMYQLSVSQVYMHHVINLGLQDKVDEATALLGSLPRKDRIATAQRTFSFASSKLQLPFHAELDDVSEYVSAAKVALLCLKVLKTSLKEGDDCVFLEDWCNIDERLNLYKRLLTLQVAHSVYLTPTELADRMHCKKLFEKKVMEVADQISTSEAASNTKQNLISSLPQKAINFCGLLGYKEEQFCVGLTEHLAQQDKLDQAMIHCRDLLQFSAGPPTAVLLSSIVRQVWTKLERAPTSLNREALLVMWSMAAQVLPLCDAFLLLDAVKMFQLCSLLFAVHCQCASDCEEGIGDSEEDREGHRLKDVASKAYWFKEDGLVLDPSCIVPVAVQYATTTLPLGEKNSPSSSPLTRNTPLPYQPQQMAYRGDVNALLKLTLEVNKTLQDNGHSQLALHCTLQTLESYLHHISIEDGDISISNPVLEQAHTTTTALLNGLIGKVLSSRRLDHDYALALLLTAPPTIAVQRLKAIRAKSISNYSRVIAVCKLAIDYSLAAKVQSVAEESLTILCSAQWGKTFSKYKVSFTEAFRGGQEEKKTVVSVLLRHKEIELNLIFKYCRDYGFDDQVVLGRFLIVLLTEWEDGYHQKVLSVISHLRNKQAVYEHLATILLQKVDPYDYDRIAFILQCLSVIEHPSSSLNVEQGLLLLDCLKRYPRTTPPSDYEREWFVSRISPPSSAAADASVLDSTIQTSSSLLPEVSSSCLPFHPLLSGNPMKIIGPELSSDTVAKLIPIAKIVQLSNDEFFSTAIMNIIRSHDSHVTSEDPTSLRSVSFTDVAHLVLKIQDPKYALRVSKWLAKELKNDSERAEALQEGLSIAIHWRDKAQTDMEKQSAQEKVKIFQDLLRMTLTEQLLKEHSLDQADYLKLTSSGVVLIVSLFTDLPVSSNKPVPPVHIIAEKIAKIHNLKLDKIRRKLTEQWLLSTGSANKDMDVTQMSLLEDPTEQNDGEDESEDQLDMKRLIYLLNLPEHLEQNCILLLNWAMHTTSSNCLSRVRALQILFAIAPSELIERLSNTSISEIKEFMQRVLFVSELEALHMTTSLQAFQSCSKEGLVKSLWRNHSMEPRGLRLICELCLHYNICESGLWAKLLQRLLDFGMMPYLRHILKTLASCSWGWKIPSMPSVWQKVLLAVFQGAAAPLSPPQRQECAESLKMFHGCPFPFELDVDSLVKQFCAVGLSHCALAVALMLPTHTDRRTAVERVLGELDSVKLVALMESLGDDGVESHSQKVTEMVYQYLNSCGKHDALLGSPHFTSYVQYLISRKTINDLLIKTLQVNRVQEAVHLVEMYNGHHHPSPSTPSHPHTPANLDVLKDYLTAHSVSVEGVDIESLSL